jgi:hypothetical protein
VCGALLLADEFLPWYRAGAGGPAASAWQAFGVIDVLLALLALGAFALLALARRRHAVASSVAGRVLVTLAGLVMTVTLLVRLLVGPPGGLGHGSVSARPWAWAGLVLVAGLTAGALAALRDEGIPRGREREPADVPKRPAPAA